MIVRSRPRSVQAATLGLMILSLGAAGCSPSGGGSAANTALSPAAKARFTPVKSPSPGPRKGAPGPARGR
jgi:hypothetical protein